MANPTLLIRIAGDIADLQRKTQEANALVANVATRMQQMGTQMTAALSVPLIALGAISVRSAVQVESAFNAVKKTTGQSAEEIQALKVAFKEMSEGFAVQGGVKQLASIAATAGQLNVAAQFMEEFVQTTARLDVAVESLSAEEAATGLAQFANITRTSQAEFDNLASALVDLGNNGASTERAIMDMGLRLAGAGAQVGMSQGQILGFANALASVGIEAESGGSAFSRLFAEIGSAAASGGKQLEKFARVAGTPTAAFRELAKTDSAAAVIAFVEGLKRLKDQGENVFAVLENLGISEIRMRDALLRAAGAGDLLRESVERGSRAYAENTALAKEADQANQSTAAQFQRLRNAAENVVAEFGEGLLPAFRTMIEVLRAAVEPLRAVMAGFGALPEWVKGTTVAVAALAVAIGPAMLAVSGLARAMLVLQTAAAVATVGMAGFRNVIAAVSLVSSIRSAADATALLKMSLGGLAGLVSPGGLVMVGLAALAVLFVNAGRRAQEAARAAQEAADKFRTALAGMGLASIHIELDVKYERRKTLRSALPQRMAEQEAEDARMAGARARAGRGAVSLEDSPEARERRKWIADSLEELQRLDREINELNERAVAIGVEEEKLRAVVGAGPASGLDTVTEGTEKKKQPYEDLRRRIEGTAEALQYLRTKVRETSDYAQMVEALDTLTAAQAEAAKEASRHGLAITDEARAARQLATAAREAAAGAGMAPDFTLQNSFGVKPPTAFIDPDEYRRRFGVPALQDASDAAELFDQRLEELAQRVRGLSSLGRVFGAFGNSLARVADDAANLISGFKDLGSVGGGVTGIPSMTELLTSGPGLQVMGAIGSLASGLLGSMFGESEAERERNNLMRQNNQALKDLTARAAGLMVSGNSLVAARGALGGVTASGLSSLKGLGLGAVNGSNQRAFLEGIGMSLAQLKLIAESAGITIVDEQGRLIGAALKQLGEAIGPLIDTLTKFNKNSFADLTTLADARAQIYGTADDPMAALQAQLATFEAVAGGAAGAFGLDDALASSAEGRAAIQEGIKQLFEMIASNTLTPEMLGGFTSVQEMLQALLGVNTALGGLADAAGKAAGSMQNVASGFKYQLRAFQAMDARIIGGAAPTMPPPFTGAAPVGGRTPTSRPRTGETGGALTLNGGLTVNVVAPAGSDPDAFARAIYPALRREIVSKAASRGRRAQEIAEALP
jgi:TP901 family phage tail tape measure protein